MRLTDEQRERLAIRAAVDTYADNQHAMDVDAALARIDELDALREQLDAAQTALVDAETVKLERDALRGKIAKLRAMCAEHIYVLDVREVLAILDEVNNA